MADTPRKRAPNKTAAKSAAKTSDKTSTSGKRPARKATKPASATKTQKEAGGGPQPQILIGIGASAGGLGALKSLISRLVPNGRTAYIVAQHVSPQHTSMMVELLAPKTELKVVKLDATCVPEPDTLYIIPPNTDAELLDGKLCRRAMGTEPGPRPSVDRLFCSIAKGMGENCVGIVLSGTGRDGGIGVRAIREVNGVVLVQEPDSAEYDGMPRAAIDTGSADLILTPDRMGEALRGTISKLGPLRDNLPADPAQIPDSLNAIYELVRQTARTDLSHYKSSTVLRRINRRAVLANCESLEAYLKHLHSHREDCRALALDLSVCVTEFFRDGEPFEVLKNVISDTLSNYRRGDIARFWVAGCASGEEAYSIAILAAEYQREHQNAPEILIFVSDINDNSLNMARRGEYPASAVENLPPELVKRYFSVHGTDVLVHKDLRKNMVFALQNLATDPPFSKLDLISCRNVLIYFEPSTQRRVLGSFHYALKPERHLLLGKSETVDAYQELFEPAHKKARIYRRSDHPTVLTTPQLMKLAKPMTGAAQTGNGRSALKSNQRDVAERTRDLLASAYAPPSVLVNGEDRIVHFMGDLSPFITLPRGPADWHVHEMVTPPISTELRALIHRCRREQQTIRGGNYTLEVGGKMQRVTPVAHLDQGSDELMVLLAFETREILDAQDRQGAGENAEPVIREMEVELATTREHLQTVVEEVETANEELQTLNEELQSSNEELQSTNEELQTSNEELQSTNEELLTVNDELANKTNELETSRSDLLNVKESLDFPLIVVNQELAITQFNQQAEKVARLAALGRGDILTHVAWHFPTPGLGEHAREVIDQQTSYEEVFKTGGGQWLRLRIIPYRSTGSGAVGGAILTFADVSKDEKARQIQAEREAMHRIMLESSSVGMAVTNSDGRILECNPVMSNLLQYNQAQLLKLDLDSLIHPAEAKSWVSGLRSLRNERRDVLNSELRLRRKDGSHLWCSIHSAAIRDADGVLERVVSQIQDISSARQKYARLDRERTQLRLLNQTSKHVLEATSLSGLRSRVLADLSVLYDDMRVSFLTLSQRRWLVVGDSVQPADWVSTAGIKFDVGRHGGYLTKLRAEGAVATNKLESSEVLAPYQHEFERLGTLALLDIPVFRESELSSVLRLEANTEYEWSEFDRDTLRLVSDLLSVAERDFETMAERESAMESLLNQRERMAVTLRSIGDGVITTNTDGLVEYLNPAAQEITGWSQKDAENRSLFNIYRVVEGETLAPVANPVERCLHEGDAIEQHELDMLLLTRDERRVPVNHSAAPLRNSDGELIGAVLVFRDVSETRMFTRELSRRATHDPLTELVNRTEFERRLELVLRKAQQGKGMHSVLFIDLDRFKAVNDSAGHSAGDALLKEIGQLMRNSLRQSDTLGRIGGDEFAVLLDSCPLSRAQSIAEQTLNAVRGFRFNWQGRTFSVGASIGIVEVGPEPLTISEVLVRADSACYTAKHRGRNQVAVYDHEDVQHKGTAERTELLAQLGRAVEEDQFALALQTALATESGATPYQELLLRLPEPDGNLLAAEEFLPTAQRYGMVGGIDRWVIRSALTVLSTTLLQDNPGLFALNIAGPSLADKRFHDYLKRKLLESSVPPERLCFEIGEAAVIEFKADVQRFIEAFAELGCKFALDDFGGGVGSFKLLKDLPIDFVKIGGSYMESLQADNIDRTLIGAICQVSHDTGRKVIATRVSDEAMRSILCELGVDYIQGHVHSKPIIIAGAGGQSRG